MHLLQALFLTSEKRAFRIRRQVQGEKMTGQKPVAKFKAGQVSAAIWENDIKTKEGKQTTMLKATVQRRYKDSSGEWKSSDSFSRNEIPLAIFCLKRCF